MQLCNQKFMIEAIKEAFERSVNNVLNPSLLYKAFIHFSNIRQCCVPWPFLNPHWYFDRIFSKKNLLIACKYSHKNLRNQRYTDRSAFFKDLFPSLENSFNICQFLKWWNCIIKESLDISRKKDFVVLKNLQVYVSWVTFFGLFV